MKDAEEKKSIIDSCIASSRVFYSAKQSTEICECSYKKFKFNGASAYDAGMKCAEESMNRLKNN